MPFTLAHAAAALPFRRTRLVLSALVIGCFSPDFEYFLRLVPRGRFGHTPMGLFAFDLPLSVLIFWLFHAYAREPILAWLPPAFRQRIPANSALSSLRNIRGVALVLASIIIGAATHILWDSFTHPFFWPDQYLHFLHRTIQLPLLGQVRYTKFFQHLSTLVGLVVLAFWIRHWYRHTPPLDSQPIERHRKNESALLAALCLVAIFAALLRGLLGIGLPTNLHQSEGLLAEIVITAITVFWLEVLAYGVFRAQRHSIPKNA